MPGRKREENDRRRNEKCKFHLFTGGDVDWVKNEDLQIFPVSVRNRRKAQIGATDEDADRIGVSVPIYSLFCYVPNCRYLHQSVRLQVCARIADRPDGP